MNFRRTILLQASFAIAFLPVTSYAVDAAASLLKDGNVHLEKKSLDMAIAAYSEAIRLDPKNVDAYCGRAKAYGMKGNLDQAKADIETALSIAPNSAEAHHLNSVISARNGDVKTAIAEASEAIRIDPTLAKAYFNRANVVLLGLEFYSGNVDLVQAERDLKKAIELNPHDADAWCSLGFVHRLKRDWNSSMEFFNKAIDIDRGLWRGYLCRGDLYLEQANVSEAITDYNRAIEINPHFAAIYANRGLGYRAQKDDQRAQADWTTARKLDPRVAIPHVCAAKFHYLNRDFTRSIKESTNAISIDPTNALAYLVRSQANGDLGNWSDVVVDSTASLRLEPENGVAYSIRGSAELQRGEFEKAVADGSEAIRNGRAYDGYGIRSVAFLRLRKFDKAAEDLEMCRRLNTADPMALVGLAYLRLEERDLRKALQYCQQAIDLDASYVDAYICRAVIYMNQNQYELSLSEATKAIRHGGHVRGYAARAAAELALGYVAKAEADFQAAHLDANDPVSETLRIDLLIAKRDFAQALEECQRQILAKPKSSIPYFQRSRINNAENRFIEALQDATESIKRGGGVAAQIERGKSLQKLGRYQEAIQELDNIIAAAPNWPQGYLHRGQIRLELGDLKQAIDDETQAIRLGCDQNSYMLRGMAYMLAGELDKAETDFQKATTITLDRFRGQLGLAAVAARRKDTAKTAEHLTKAIQIDRNNSIAFNNLAVVQASNGDLNAAIANLDEAVRLSPKMYEAYQNRAAVHRRMGNQEKAIADQARAKEIERERAATFGADYIRLGLRPEVNLIEMLPDVQR